MVSKLSMVGLGLSLIDLLDPVLSMHTVYDSGSLFAPEVLDISSEDLMQKFLQVSVCAYADVYTRHLVAV